MKLIWSEQSWEDYLYWQQNDKKVLKREPFKGIGEPEPLKHSWSGYWSRRINLEHRIIYKALADSILIAQCRYHY